MSCACTLFTHVCSMINLIDYSYKNFRGNTEYYYEKYCYLQHLWSLSTCFMKCKIVSKNSNTILLFISNQSGHIHVINDARCYIAMQLFKVTRTKYSYENYKLGIVYYKELLQNSTASCIQVCAVTCGWNWFQIRFVSTTRNHL